MNDIVEMLKKKLEELSHSMSKGSHDEDDDDEDDVLSGKNKKGLSIFSVSLSAGNKRHDKPSDEAAFARKFPSEIHSDPLELKEIVNKLQSKLPTDVILSTFDEKNSPKPGMDFLDVSKAGKNSGDYALKLMSALNSLADKEGSQKGELRNRMKVNSASIPFLDNELTMVMGRIKEKKDEDNSYFHTKSKKKPLEIDILKSLLNNL
jgi:hypothetical protein